MEILQILHFVFMGGLGAFLSVLIWTKEFKEIYSFGWNYEEWRGVWAGVG
jgi:hypothetical protein